jgi:hypothetical protein
MNKQIKVLFKLTWGEGDPADDHVSAVRDCLLTVFKPAGRQGSFIRKQRTNRALLTADLLPNTVSCANQM